MAQAFAAAYQNTTWNAIYTSPLRRAVTTAEPLRQALGMEMQLRDELKELSYGAWEGCDADTINRQFRQDYLCWMADPAWNPPTGGETAISVARRGLQIVEEIKDRFVCGNVLIVSHKSTIRIILCTLLGIDVGRYRFRLDCPVGSVSTVVFTTHGPLLQTLANRTYLDKQSRSLSET